MSAREVTSELKANFWPQLHNIGFSTKGRAATRVDGAVVAVVHVMGLSSRTQSVLGVPPGSFAATVGVDLKGPGPISFVTAEYEPTTDLAQMRVQLALAPASPFSKVESRIWVLGPEFTAEEAVLDLWDSFQRDGLPFLTLWSDLTQAYQVLSEVEDSMVPVPHSNALLSIPGRAGSWTRNTHLAIVAARLGLMDDEIVHLQNLLAAGEHAPFSDRIEALRTLQRNETKTES